MPTSLSDRYREFEAAEFESRQASLREALAERGICAAIVSDPLNVRWLTGYRTLCANLWTPVVVLISPRGTMLVAPPDGTGLDVAVVDQLGAWQGGDLVTELTDLLDANDAGDQPLGMELGPGMQQALPASALASLWRGQRETVDICDVLWRLRSIKSEAEVTYLRKAASTTLAGYEQGFAELREGMTEREFATIVRTRWLEMGADNVESLFIAADWKSVRFAHVEPVDSPILPGCILNVDGGCLYGGYRADIFRTACIGTPNDPFEVRLLESIHRATSAAISVIRGGVPIRDVYEAALASMQADGFAHLLASETIGHGIGLEMHEWPTITRGSDVVLQPNMVLCIEPWTLDPADWSHGRNHEDMVRVTANGAELLTPALPGLYVAPA